MTEPIRVDLHLPHIRLSALDYGEPFHGAPPLVVLHGQADLAWSMDPVAAALAARFRVVSIDHRGHGDSDRPGAYAFAHFVADLGAAITHLSFDRPVLVGHSLGAQVASQFAGLYPERVRALVIAEGIGPPVALADDSPEGRRVMGRARVELLTVPLRHKPLRDLDEATARLVAAHPGLDPARAAFLAAEGTRRGPDGGLVWKFDPLTRHWLVGFERAITEERWSLVECPVLAVTGAIAWERWWSKLPLLEGSATGPDPAELARRIGLFRDCEHVELANAGHMLAFDQPDQLNDVIADFLSRRLR